MAEADPHFANRARANVERVSGARAPARFTLDGFDRMIAAGVFDGPGSAELVRGEIVRVNAKYLPHVRSQEDLFFALRTMLAGHRGIAVHIEPSVLIDAQTTREPDLVLCRPQPRRAIRIPAADVRLAIEVADTTLREDLGAKLEDYARAGVPRVWVVDLGGEVTHDCTAPGPDGYAQRRVVRFGEPLALAPLADAEVVVPPGGFD